MRNLIEFLTKNVHWFVFVLLEVISAVLLFRYNTYQQSVWFSSANYVAGQVREIDSKVESFFHLEPMNEQLSRRNLELEHEVSMLRKQLEKQGVRDTTWGAGSQAALAGQLQLIPAKVVDNSVSRPNNLITIAAGHNLVAALVLRMSRNVIQIGDVRRRRRPVQVAEIASAFDGTAHVGLRIKQWNDNGIV